MSNVVIKSEEEMGRFLTELTRRIALKRISMLLEGEDEVQDALAAKLEDLKPSAKSGELEEDDEDGDSGSDVSLDASGDEAEDDGEDDQAGVEVQEISPQTIIEKLNTIRSGQSLKRSDIRDQMEEYIEALDDAEKVSLNAFLDGIAGIVTGAEDAEEAEEPSPEVKMKTKTKVVDRIKPKKKKVVVAAEPEETVTVKKKKKKPTGSAEDTTPPIKVS